MVFFAQHFEKDFFIFFFLFLFFFSFIFISWRLITSEKDFFKKIYYSEVIGTYRKVSKIAAQAPGYPSSIFITFHILPDLLYHSLIHIYPYSYFFF